MAPNLTTPTPAHKLPSSPLEPLIINGDSRAVLAQFPANTFDAVITDPPYELGLTRSANTKKRWDSTGIAFDPQFWGEVLRVLKPGGNLIAFGAARTYHRLTVAIEDAGFEVRDSILAWVRGDGMVKSKKFEPELVKAGRGDLVDLWSQQGRSLKPAYEPIVVARKEPEGTIVDNIIAHGVGGLGIDATRIPTDEDLSRRPGQNGTGVIPFQRAGLERSISHPDGRWPTNMLMVHTPNCTEEQCAAHCPTLGLPSTPGDDKSRFFPTFFYHGKAAPSERPKVGGVSHLTVKPLPVMEWLMALGAMPGHLILDPFAGSGTTLEAAMRQGVRSVGIESDATYVPLIEERVARERARQED